ncbi:MAG: hypothetical protein K2H57_03095, partial [Duncaniella sp.]|nr:hypothetical protein [Duncaniella sp.]
MRLNPRRLSVMLTASAALAASAQSITTSPAIITENTKDSVITFHSAGGNRGRLDATASTGVYA